ncbi:hypothetical protein D3C72_1215400 [compost metagenome]
MAAGTRCWTAAVIGPSQARFSPVGSRKIRKARTSCCVWLPPPGRTRPISQGEFIARMKQGAEIRKATAGTIG